MKERVANRGVTYRCPYRRAWVTDLQTEISHLSSGLLNDRIWVWESRQCDSYSTRDTFGQEGFRDVVSFQVENLRRRPPWLGSDLSRRASQLLTLDRHRGGWFHLYARLNRSAGCPLNQGAGHLGNLDNGPGLGNRVPRLRPRCDRLRTHAPDGQRRRQSHLKRVRRHSWGCDFDWRTGTFDGQRGARYLYTRATWQIWSSLRGSNSVSRTL